MSHTSDVRVTPLLEDADTERYHGQKAPPGSVSLKEKPSLGSTEQIHSFTPSFPIFCSSFVAVQGVEEFVLISFILFLAVLGLHCCMVAAGSSCGERGLLQLQDLGFS